MLIALHKYPLKISICVIETLSKEKIKKQLYFILIKMNKGAIFVLSRIQNLLHWLKHKYYLQQYCNN